MNEYLVLSRTNGTTRTGSPYALLKVANTDETLNLAVWDLAPTAQPEVGQLVTIYMITEKGGKKSCGAQDLAAGGFPDAGHPLYHLLPYSRFPAATSMHHAFPGGLLNHTHQMLHMLSGLYPCLPYPLKVERCILAILFHDYGKVYEYNVQGETQPDMYLMGHIYISAHKLHNVLDQRGVDADEVKRIVHCVLAHHGTREFGSPVVPCLPEAALVNYLDNISAKTDAMEGAGDMEMVPALGTHIVKENRK